MKHSPFQKMVNIVTWNVNGLRTRIIDDKDSKQFSTKTDIHKTSHLGKLIEEFHPDIICFNETRCCLEKTQEFKITKQFPYCYYSSSELKGARSGNRYSGVAVWSRFKPYKVSTELPFISTPNKEGRIITLYFNEFILINTYQPNTGTNFDHRITEWDPAMNLYLQFLKENYNIPIIWTGDLNIARTHHDLFIGDVRYHLDKQGILKYDLEKEQQKLLETPIMKGTGKSALPGFTREERENFEDILSLGYVDVWRHLNPDTTFNGYTWWNMRIKPYRSQNKGWRIDYFVIDDKHINKILDCKVFKHIGETTNGDKIGSDHAPIGITLNCKL